LGHLQEQKREWKNPGQQIEFLRAKLKTLAA
jgi:hypothetical protein